MRRVRRSGHDQGYWEVFSDLGLSLTLLLFIVILYQFVQYSDLWKRRRVESAQREVKRLIDAALADPAYAGRYVVCPADGDRQPIIFGAEALFATASPAVQPAGVELFRRFALVLGTVDTLLDRIDVEGHTDSIAIWNDSIRSNWQLSTLRALRVSEVLLAEWTLDPRKLSVVGRGEWQALRPNAAEDGRAANRRVEVSLFYSPARLERLGEEELTGLVRRLESELRGRTPRYAMTRLTVEASEFPPRCQASGARAKAAAGLPR